MVGSLRVLLRSAERGGHRSVPFLRTTMLVYIKPKNTVQIEWVVKVSEFQFFQAGRKFDPIAFSPMSQRHEKLLQLHFIVHIHHLIPSHPRWLCLLGLERSHKSLTHDL